MKIIFSFLLLISSAFLSAQQIPDKDFEPSIANPAYLTQSGSVILLDEAHYNFHTAEGRYFIFTKILKKDGYQVVSNANAFTPERLKSAKILVIANALNKINSDESGNETPWQLPTPSAFTVDEIKYVNEWVKSGGSLFLIADHMPFPGAAYDLAKSFGFILYNGFASKIKPDQTSNQRLKFDAFTKENKTLAIHPITTGRNSKEQVEQVATFGGQAFEIPSEAISLLTFNENYRVLLPDTAWVFSEHTKTIPAKGLSQGAILQYGKGRIAMFGEAAMFSAQLQGKNRLQMGLNSPNAKQNVQFLLNLVHWLDHYDKK